LAVTNFSALDAGFYPFPSALEPLRCGLLSLVSDMQRRDFVKLLSGTAAVWPLAAGAQMGNKLPTIAVLGDLASVWNPWTAAFADRMGELGWIAGRNIAIEYRWSEGRQAAVAEIAAEFVRQKVDIIVTYGGAVTILKQATSIPIVFAIAVDPVGIGLVASLSHPGGNVTGLSIQTTDLAGKRLELYRELVPGLRRLAIIFDAGYPAAVLASREVQAVARTFGLEVAPHEIRRVEDIAPVFDLLKDQADAVYVVEDALTSAYSKQFTTLALTAHLPMMFNIGNTVQVGALISYGPNFPTLFRRAADFVDKILRGAKPGDLPVEQPTKFDLVVNLKTARVLGLTLSESFLARADEVIE
jgi:putative tryptophan/tyrosine transport system substrate-binding protein